MQTHFAAAFVAASTFLFTSAGTALARSPAHVASPASANDTSAWVGETGQASYYGPGYHGHRSASGDRFDQMAMTAAHAWLPFGTRVKVILAGTSRTVVVTITDRLYSSRRVVDLSVAAAEKLGMIGRGVAEVRLAPA